MVLKWYGLGEGADNLKLNMDCIRDVMLTLEDKLTLEKNLGFKMITLKEIITFEQLKLYSKEEVFYSLYNLNETKFIDARIYQTLDGAQDCSVLNITFAGHEFLQNIRSDSVWKSVKESIIKIGGASFPVITEIAKSLILKQFSKL